MSGNLISPIETTLPTSGFIESYVKDLTARYFFLRLSEIGRSVMRRPLWCLMFGRGKNRVFYNGSHHANEYITANLLLKFIDRLCLAYAFGTSIHGESAREIIDGIDLNLQYPAGWEQVKANKYARGNSSPAPADFVGSAPLSRCHSSIKYIMPISEYSRSELW